MEEDRSGLIAPEQPRMAPNVVAPGKALLPSRVVAEFVSMEVTQWEFKMAIDIRFKFLVTVGEDAPLVMWSRPESHPFGPISKHGSEWWRAKVLQAMADVLAHVPERIGDVAKRE